MIVLGNIASNDVSHAVNEDLDAVLIKDVDTDTDQADGNGKKQSFYNGVSFKSQY